MGGVDENAIPHLTAPDVLMERITGLGRWMFLAWDDERVVGFAALRSIDETSVELAGIIVLGDMLGRGIGTLLLVAAVEAATASGFQRVVVRTEATNERALVFYRHHGFGDDRSVVENVGGTRVALVEMARAI
jgi:ribosomal protein S18 acetylase RimI-like enzyme